MKKLTKKQRNKIYEKAIEIAYLKSVETKQDGLFTVVEKFFLDAGLCITLKYADYLCNPNKQRYYYWSVVNWSEEFNGYDKDENYTQDNDYREILLHIFYESTK